MPDAKGVTDEENFDEAIKHLRIMHTAVDWRRSLLSGEQSIRLQVPASVEQLLKNAEIDDESPNRTEFEWQFWAKVHALRQFVREHGRVPLSGTLPDMTADSHSYALVTKVHCFIVT